MRSYPSGLSHSGIRSRVLLELGPLRSLPPWHLDIISLDSCQGNELPSPTPSPLESTQPSFPVSLCQRSYECRPDGTSAGSTPALALSLWPVSGWLNVSGDMTSCWVSGRSRHLASLLGAPVPRETLGQQHWKGPEGTEPHPCVAQWAEMGAERGTDMPGVTQHDRGGVEVRRPRGSPSQWQVTSHPTAMFTKPPETQTKTMSKHLFLDSPNKCDDPSCTLALTSALVTLGTRSFFVGGCPVHWRMVSNISG